MTNTQTPASFVILGGSNSLLTNGWVDKLKQIHPEPERIVNLSIGAATSAMGIYRLLTCTELPENPVILWEYSLNEANYVLNRQSPAVLSYHLEWLLEICARRGYRVLPVLLYNKAEATGAEKNPYRNALRQTLEGHRLTQVDAQRLWRERFAHLDADRLYKENPHYSTETDFLATLADEVIEAGSSARVPARDPDLRQEFSGRDLQVVLPDIPASGTFTNRLLNCGLFPFRSDLPFSTAGRLLACYLIATRAEPAILFQSSAGERGPYSTQISPKEGGPLKQLKHLLLWSPKEPPLEVRGSLTLCPQAMNGRKPLVQHTMSWNPPAKDGAPGIGGLIGLLMEVDG